VQAAATHGVDFYGSWQDSWKPTERDAQGRRAAFLSSAFPYDATQDVFRCPAGETLRHGAGLNRGHSVRTRVYRASKEACRTCALREQRCYGGGTEINAGERIAEDCAPVLLPAVGFVSKTNFFTRSCPRFLPVS